MKFDFWVSLKTRSYTKKHLSDSDSEVQATIQKRKVLIENKHNSLSHTKWMCKYQ